MLRSVIRCGLMVSLIAVVVSLSGCGSERPFKVYEAQHAFRSAGFHLRVDSPSSNVAKGLPIFLMSDTVYMLVFPRLNEAKVAESRLKSPTALDYFFAKRGIVDHSVLVRDRNVVVGWNGATPGLSGRVHLALFLLR